MPEDNPELLRWKRAQHPQPVTLGGRYVTLEPLNADRHCGALWASVRGEDNLWTWMPDGPFASQSLLHQPLAEKQSSSSAVFLAIIPRDTDRRGNLEPPGQSEEIGAAGYASFMRIEPAHGVVEVGNILLSPSLQRTRAATEAMYLMASHVFDNLGYRRYEWKCNAKNEPSRRAALRLGFTFEGIFRQHMVVKGLNRDTAWFSMLDHEWPARKQAFEAWLDPDNFDGPGRQRRTLAEFAE